MVKKTVKKPIVMLKDKKSITTNLKNVKTLKKSKVQLKKSAEVSTKTTCMPSSIMNTSSSPPPPAPAPVIKKPAKKIVPKLMKPEKSSVKITKSEVDQLKMGKNKKVKNVKGDVIQKKSIINAMQQAIEKHNENVKEETTTTTNIEMVEPIGTPSPSSSPSSSPRPNIVGKKIVKKSNKLNKIIPEPFDEKLFTTKFSQENITNLVNVAKQVTSKLLEKRKTIIDEDYILAVQVTGYRVPLLPTVQVSRILLPHSIETNEQSICLFVKDLKRGRRIDYEPTIEHYRNLLNANKIQYNITIVPITKLCTEYATYELKRTLIHAHDKFLVDKGIASHVNGFLGHKAMMAGRQAIPINMKKKDLQKEMEKQLRKVLYKLVPSGSTQSINVGRSSMANDKIAENIIDLLRQLGERIHPGGSANINTVYLKVNMNLATVVPIYKNQAPPPNGIPQIKTIKNRILESEVESIKKHFRKFDVNSDGKIIRKIKKTPLKRSAAAAKLNKIPSSEGGGDDKQPMDKKKIKLQVKSENNIITDESPAVVTVNIDGALANGAKKLKPIIINKKATKGGGGVLNKKTNRNKNKKNVLNKK